MFWPKCTSTQNVHRAIWTYDWATCITMLSDTCTCIYIYGLITLCYM